MNRLIEDPNQVYHNSSLKGKGTKESPLKVSGPRRYVALLSQSGTDAPVATVLENTLGGTVVWTRDDIGEYVGTLSGAFTANKTWFSVTCRYDNAYVAQAYWIDTNSFEFYVNDFAAQAADEWEKISIEIRVYP